MASTAPVYIVLTVYVLLMASVTFLARRQNRAAAATAGDAKAVSTHYLAEKGFGVLVLSMTMMASIFSGYTVVGVPNEASINGFDALRWIPLISVIGIGMTMLNPRLRRLSVVRNYESPGDFIMDRYNSVPMKWIATLSMCLPQVLYLAVQFHALASLLHTLTNDELSFNVMVPISMLLLLCFEYLGGMRSVAYTDAVQSTFMVLLFLVTPLAIAVKYGGFVGQVQSPAVDGGVCSNSVEDARGRPGFGCLNYASSKVNNVTVPAFYLRTPSTITNVNNLIFIWSGLSFPLNPHVMIRVFMSRVDKDIKFVTRLIYVMGIFAQMCGVIIGVTVLSNEGTFAPDNQKIKDGFFKILREWQNDSNFFMQAIVYCMILAAVAGIMSTADSALIGVSNTISVDLYRGWYKPNASGKDTIHFGKFVSVVTAAMAGGVAVYLQASAVANGESVSYGNVITFQSGKCASACSCVHVPGTVVLVAILRIKLLLN